MRSDLSAGMRRSGVEQSHQPCGDLGPLPLRFDELAAGRTHPSRARRVGQDRDHRFSDLRHRPPVNDQAGAPGDHRLGAPPESPATTGTPQAEASR